MDKRVQDCHLRLNLIDATRAQLRLLQEVGRHPNLYFNLDLLKVAIYRYEFLWLPLKAAFTHKDLVPPLDVYWVWHCHMVSPLQYRNDTYRVTGTVVDHHYMKNDRHYKEGLDNARILWKSTYANERFEINIDAEWNSSHVQTYKSKIAYDLLAAVERQRVFSYQVCMSHYKDRRFLKSAVKRYKQYLCLKRKHLGTVLVPCYDFDLIWHAHQAHPVVYAEETLAVLDRILNHDDSMTDRTANSKLRVCDAHTRVFWSQMYAASFAVCGAMYRGEPPQGALYPETAEQLSRNCSNSVVTEVRSVSLLGYPLERKSCTFLTIQAVGRTTRPSDNARIFHRRAYQLNLPERRSQRHYGKFAFNASTQSALRFSLVSRRGICCCCAGCLGASGGGNGSGGTVLCSEEILFKDAVGYDIGDSPRFTFSRTINLRLDEEEDEDEEEGGRRGGGGGLGKTCPVQVRFAGVVVAEHRKACKLRLVPQTTTAELLSPEDWEPVYLGDISSGRGGSSRQAVRALVGLSSLINHNSRLCYKVRVLHSTEVMMSAVYVFQQQDMLQAVAHTVGGEQIPTPSQVSDPCHHVCMDPTRGERALVVKNAKGDWAFCVGRWTSNKHSKNRGEDGFLRIKVYSMATGKMSVIRVPGSADDHGRLDLECSLADTVVDLRTGHVTIGTEAEELAPRVALTFAVSVLYLLCRPDSFDLNACPPDTTSQATSLTTSNQEEVQLLGCGGGGGGGGNSSGNTVTGSGGIAATSNGRHLTLAPSLGLDRLRKCSFSTQGGSTAAAQRMMADSMSCGDMAFMVAAGYGCDEAMLIPSNDNLYRASVAEGVGLGVGVGAVGEGMASSWCEGSGAPYGGFDRNYSEPDGSRSGTDCLGEGSFGGCSGDAADYGGVPDGEPGEGGGRGRGGDGDGAGDGDGVGSGFGLESAEQGDDWTGDCGGVEVGEGGGGACGGWGVVGDRIG